jgi:hypothetical protein
MSVLAQILGQARRTWSDQACSGLFRLVQAWQIELRFGIAIAQDEICYLAM